MTPMTLHHVKDVHEKPEIPDIHQDTFSKAFLGFWIYLMTDCVIFATLFATFAVLRNATFGGPTTNDIFHLSTAFIETMLLLFSSLASGIGMLFLQKNRRNSAILWFVFTFILGASFIAMELHEFNHLAATGNSWERSAFLSSFFTLVGTHGFHVSIGLFWLLVMIGQLLTQGITAETFRRSVLWNMFWHFLDLVWIFIFTFVYLIGVL